MPIVPGSYDGLFPNLQALLQAIASDAVLDRVFTWPATGTQTTLRDAVRGLGSCGLLERIGHPSKLSLTDEAKYFLDTLDKIYLIATIHAHIRFVGEVLPSIGDGCTHEELNRTADTEYGLGWGTLDQVRRRTNWLRAAGLVELWTNNQLVLTTPGREFSQELDLADPKTLPHRRRERAQHVTLPEPGEAIASALAALDQNALRTRPRPFRYVAGDDLLESLSQLVGAATPEITRDEFVTLCVDRFGVRDSSAKHTLSTLRSMGLIEQTGLDSFSPTLVAMDWLDSGNPVDLVRILHIHLAAIGETADALERQTETGAVVRQLRQRYPDLGLGRNEVAKRLRLLHDAGLAEHIGHTRYQLTPLGSAFRDSLPLMEPDGVERDHAVSMAKPGRTDRTDRMAETIRQADELVEASTDSANYQRFERAVAETFRTLGLEVQAQGGPGKTDLVLTLWLSPTERRRVVVEVKTDGAGKLGDEVNLDVVEEHRVHHHAQQAAIVGPDFGGRLRNRAQNKRIALITAGTLARCLRQQLRAPLYPNELAEMFTADQSDRVEEIWSTAEQRNNILRHVVVTLWEAANDPTEIEHNHGALGSREVRRMGKLHGRAPDLGEVEQALGFLSAAYVAGATVARSDAYLAAAPPSHIAARLRALADAVEGDPGELMRGRDQQIHMHSGEVSAFDASNHRLDRRTSEPEISSVAVRNWARSQGYMVSERGRLPNELVQAYRATIGSAGGQSTLDLGQGSHPEPSDLG